MTADLSNLMVEVLHNRGDDKHPDWSVGSGFFVGAKLVLTALHNVDGPGELLVRVHGTEEHLAVVLLQGDEDRVDLAVLKVSDVVVDVPPLRYGAVDRSAPAVLERCWAVGFPRFKERAYNPKPLRLSAQVNGEIPTGENLDQQLLTLQVRRSPRPLPSSAVHESEWAGMSGATVFSGNNIIVGVITEHHLPEGESALTVVPITAIDLLPKSEATKWWKTIGLDRQALVRLPSEAASSLSFSTCPTNYIPLPRSSPFQSRPGEVEHLEHLLFGSTRLNSPICLGLIGMAGIGKTQLAVELAYTYREHFPSGLFWTSANVTTFPAWQRQLAELAKNTEYLPSGDEISHPENEAKRARHFCRYLAQHPDTLLILDNVESIEDTLSALIYFAGSEISCTILYTSRTAVAPPHVHIYHVPRLPDGPALCLLLARRPALLAHIPDNAIHIADQAFPAPISEEMHAALNICHYVEGLPLALILLRDLLQDERLTLVHLWEQQRKRGTLNITGGLQNILKARLFSAIEQSWEKIDDADTQRLFKLAAYFPEATPIPLWLLGLATNLEGTTSLEPLGHACDELQNWSLLEQLPDNAVRLHPLIREFARKIAIQEDEASLLKATHECLIAEFTNINKLEQRALGMGYWQCLEQVQAAAQYAQLLGAGPELERVAHWLARDSFLLGNSDLWPEEMPALFYQQLTNRALEEGYALMGNASTTLWLHQLNQVDAEDQTLWREFRHPATVTSFALSPDGRLLFTGCADGTAQLWNVVSGQVIRELQGHTHDIIDAAFSRDGDYLATCSSNEALQLWNVHSGQRIQTFLGHLAEIQAVVFSPDGKSIATRSKDRTVRVLDIETGKVIACLNHYFGMTDIAFSQDGKQLLIIEDTTNSEEDIITLDSVLQWSIESEQIVRQFRPDFLPLKLSSDGKYVIGSSGEGTFIYEIESDTVVAHLPNTERFSISPDKEKIAFINASDLLEVWDVPTGQRVARYGPARNATFSANGAMVAAGSNDGFVRIWHLSSAPATNNDDGLDNKIWLETFSLDGTQLVTLTTNYIRQIWETFSKKLLKETPITNSEWWKLKIITSDDRKNIIIDEPEGISLLNMERNLKQTLMKIDPLSLSMLALSPDETQIAFEASNKNIQIWDLHTQEMITALPDFQGLTTALAFSPDGTRLVSGSTDGLARIWDTQQYTSLAILKGHMGSVISVAFASDNRIIATGDSAGTVCLWSLLDGRELHKLCRHTQPIDTLSFSPDRQFLISIDRTGQIYLWSVQYSQHTKPLATYLAPNEIGAIHWQDSCHVLLADRGSLQNRPHFYHLRLEGAW